MAQTSGLDSSPRQMDKLRLLNRPPGDDEPTLGRVCDARDAVMEICNTHAQGMPHHLKRILNFEAAGLLELSPVPMRLDPQKTTLKMYGRPAAEAIPLSSVKA